MIDENHCAECAKLWEQYRTTVHEHYRIDSKLKVARLVNDVAAITELEPLLARCCEARSVLRGRLANQHSSGGVQRQRLTRI